MVVAASGETWKNSEKLKSPSRLLLSQITIDKDDQGYFLIRKSQREMVYIDAFDRPIEKN